MKAVTDTRYYDEISKKIQEYTGGAGLKPPQMPMAIQTIVIEAEWRGQQAGEKYGYDIGFNLGKSSLETEILGGEW